MQLFNRKKVKTYQESDPDYKLQISLESLKWQHAESDKKAWEWIKKKSIDNIFLSSQIEKMDHRIKLGSYVYTVLPRKLERQGKSIVRKRKLNPFWRIIKA